MARNSFSKPPAAERVSICAFVTRGCGAVWAAATSAPASPSSASPTARRAGFLTATSLLVQKLHQELSGFLRVHQRKLGYRGFLQGGIGFLPCDLDQTFHVALQEERIDHFFTHVGVLLVRVDLRERCACAVSAHEAETADRLPA